jgi:hypothetical protein
MSFRDLIGFMHTRTDHDAPLPADAVAAVRTTSDLSCSIQSRSTAEIPVDQKVDVTGLKVSLTEGVRVLWVSIEGKDLFSVNDFEKSGLPSGRDISIRIVAGQSGGL